MASDSSGTRTRAAPLSWVKRTSLGLARMSAFDPKRTSRPPSRPSLEPIRWFFLAFGAAMKRCEFLSVFGGAVVAWPLTARGQQRDRVRQIGVLSPFSEKDPETKAKLAALKERLERLGWTDGRNVRIEYRFSDGNIDRTRRGRGAGSTYLPT